MICASLHAWESRQPLLAFQIDNILLKRAVDIQDRVDGNRLLMIFIPQIG